MPHDVRGLGGRAHRLVPVGGVVVDRSGLSDGGQGADRFCGLGVPFWPWSRGWGYRPFGGLLFLLLVVVLILALDGRGGSVGGSVTARGCGAHW